MKPTTPLRIIQGHSHFLVLDLEVGYGEGEVVGDPHDSPSHYLWSVPFSSARCLIWWWAEEGVVVGDPRDSLHYLVVRPISSA